MNNYSKMRRSNARVREWCKKRNILIEFIHHTRWQKDMFGFADAIIINNGLHLAQVKSNSWADFGKFADFCGEKSVWGYFFNVIDRKGVHVRIVR